jgi:hypothetical protein
MRVEAIRLGCIRTVVMQESTLRMGLIGYVSL